MTLETKYNIYDEVWLMYQDKPLRSTVVGILIVKGSKSTSFGDKLDYYLNITLSNDTLRSENSLFSSKEELLKSL